MNCANLQKEDKFFKNLMSRVGSFISLRHSLATQFIIYFLLFRFLQELIKHSSQNLIRVSYWIMANMEQVIEDRCSLFLALAVTDLIVATLKEDPSWQLVLEFIVGSLLNLKQVKIHVFSFGIGSLDNFYFIFLWHYNIIFYPSSVKWSKVAALTY